MKKLFLTTFVLMSLSLSFTSCEEEDAVKEPTVDSLKGSYQLFVDGTILKEGTVAFAGALQDADENWINSVTIGSNDISILISQFPVAIGATVSMDSDGDPGVTFTYNSDVYSSVSGTLTRESGSKISFDGMCKELMSSEEHTLSGFVESESYKIIK